MIFIRYKTTDMVVISFVFSLRIINEFLKIFQTLIYNSSAGYWILASHVNHNMSREEALKLILLVFFI